MPVHDGRSDSFNDRWGNRLSWPLLFLGGYVIAAGTREPSLGAFFACFKFGLNDFLTARWLWRIDSRRWRGFACFFLYVGAGLWKIAASGFVYLLVLAVMDPAVVDARQRQGRNLEVFAGAAWAAGSGFVLSGVAVAIALIAASRGKVKLWLHPSLHHARQRNVWPGSDPVATGAGLLLMISIVFSVALGIMVSGAILLALTADFPEHADALLGVLLVITIGGPFMLMVVKSLLEAYFFASSPAECWGTEPSERNAWRGNSTRACCPKATAPKK